ncbi:MAG: permease [Planctomycetes bacterium]|nr:permease [Planctomycetota bacterium]
MLTSISLGVLLRTGQVAVEASTTFLVGLLVAGVMRRMLGAEGTRRLFGGKGATGLLRAWAVGTVLPVCSLGVIPIAREMRRAGVPSGTILAFVLAAPHINPLSLLYGLTLSEPRVILCFALGSLVIAVAGGVVWECFLGKETDAPPSGDEPVPAPGVKRLASVALAAAREAVSASMGYVFLGVAFTGILAGLVPHGFLGTTMRHDDWLSPILMSAVALPSYSGPLQGMMRLGLMFEHGNSVGAAFALFEVGIGINFGMIIWLMTLFGWRRVVVWIGFLTCATLALAYAAEKPLYFAHEEASHTHAFDEWTNPFAGGFEGELSVVNEKVLEKVEILEPIALAGLALLVVAGLLANKFDPRWRLENWLTQAPATAPSSSIWNWYVPGPLLGLAALAGLVAFSVVALYIYYPEPKEGFSQVVRVRAEAFVALKMHNREEVIRRIQHWDLLTRKLQVGIFIRTGKMDPELTKVSEELRDRLEDMRDHLLAGDLEKAREASVAVEEAFQQFRVFFVDGAVAPQ